jgi:hypothetical protein
LLTPLWTLTAAFDHDVYCITDRPEAVVTHPSEHSLDDDYFLFQLY